ncbi:MAG: hypothetical protein P1U34_04510 [Coxiellaceae bacterium]|nr:hypothetical protein [Coxiellaceae bacterium]
MRNPLATLMIAEEARRRREAQARRSESEDTDVASQFITKVVDRPFHHLGVTQLVQMLLACYESSQSFDKAGVKDYLHDFDKAMDENRFPAALSALNEIRRSTAELDYSVTNTTSIKAVDIMSAHIIAFKQSHLDCEALGGLTLS